MKYAPYYGNLIWTKHAIIRMRDRGLSQDAALDAFKKPDKIEEGREKGSFRHIKHYSKSRVTVIAKQNERREWLILSAWIDPPMKGSKDEKERLEFGRYQKASQWGKFWLTLKKQLGF